MSRIDYMLGEAMRRLRRSKPHLFPKQTLEQRFNFLAVEEGKFYRFSQPTELSLYYFADRYDLRSLIVVRSSVQDFERDFAQEMGIPILHINLRGRKPREVEIQSFFTFIDDPNNLPTALHCAQGKDRTGLFSMLYRVERMGWDVHDAWQEMLRLGHRAFPWEGAPRSNFKEWFSDRYGVDLKL